MKDAAWMSYYAQNTPDKIEPAAAALASAGSRDAEQPAGGKNFNPLDLETEPWT